MNILQALPELNVGGVETGTVDLARWLTQNNHKAVIVSGGGTLVRQLENAGIKHYELAIGKKSLFTILPAIKALRAIIIKEDIDIVHARSRIPALVAFFAARSTKAVFITTAHGYYRKHLLSGVMGWGRYVIVASNVMARHMMDAFGVPFDRIRLVPRGVNIEKYQFIPPSTEKRGGVTIGMVGRMTPLKGHAYFLRAVALISRAIPHLKVVIVGDPPKGKEKYKEELKLLCRKLGIANIVEFFGNTDDVSSLLRRFDVLVLSSIVPEGFGRVIIEAQASGVPVVATKVGGVVDIIEDGKNGVLVYPRDPASLADGVQRLLKDRALAQRIAVCARKDVEDRFTLERMCRDTFAIYEEARNAQNILVIKISAIGDVILSIPSIRAIREKFPKANIKVLVGLRARNSLKGCPYINDIIVCDFDRKDKGLVGLLRTAYALRRHDFDIVVDFQNNRKSHLLSFLSFSPLRFGYNNGKLGFLLNRSIRDTKETIGPLDHQFRILSVMGIVAPEKRLELWPSPEDEKWARDFLDTNWVGRNQVLIGINMGSSDRWASKRWPLANFAKLCEELSRRYRARVVITGLRSDIDAARKVAEAAKTKPLIACGRTNVTQLAALMKHCKVFITGDSAPLHVAGAMKVPFVALFGPTDPRRHLVTTENFVVIRKDLRCSPCYKARCILKYRCMNKIAVVEVADAVGALLKVSGRDQAGSLQLATVE
ncbi:MAG: lipopolysaccharide heptosyltransferase II [Candidatus Omnitrophota bacterium]